MTLAAAVLIIEESVRRQPMIDFAVYRMGGYDILHGQDLYATYLHGYGLPFTYPPFAALVFVPFSVIPIVAAQLLWAGLSLLALIAIIDVTRRRLPVAKNRPSIAATLLLIGPAFWLEPVRHNFALGQINLFIVLLCLLDLDPNRQRKIPQGFLIGLAAGLKLTPLIFVPYFLITRRYRAASYAMAGLATTIAIGSLGGLHVSVEYWRHFTATAQRITEKEYVSNQSMDGVAMRWLRHMPDGLVWNCLVVLIVVAALWQARRLFLHGQSFAADLLVALVGLVISPVSWTHHFIWIVPTVALLATSYRRFDKWVARGLVAVFYLAPIWWVPNDHHLEFRHHGWQLLAACSFFFATVVAAMLLARQHRATVGTTGGTAGADAVTAERQPVTV